LTKGNILRTYRKPLAIFIAAIGMMFAASAMAADVTSKDEYKQALTSAEATYKTAYAACPAPSGPDRLACRRQARADWDKARGDAREAHGMLRHAEGPRQ
jgi:hypothetical protein